MSIACEFRMMSGCRDTQTSADVSNVASFGLPDPAGRSGGACTSALLKVLYANKEKPSVNPSYKDTLCQVRDILKSKGYSQVPQLSSSVSLDVDTTFDLSPEGFNGTKRAVMIGINYVGQDGALSGCINDVLNMKEYLIDVHGFKESNIVTLLDDGASTPPKKAKIMNAFKNIAAISKPGDAVYIHFSGHGVSVTDQNGDEKDGKDEAIVPLNYKNAGVIKDDAIFSNLIKPMKAGVFVTALMDCCHSGTICDLPHSFAAGQSGGTTRACTWREAKYTEAPTHEADVGDDEDGWKNIVESDDEEE